MCRLAVETLNEQGVAARLVSMPSVDHFEKQDSEYQESVLPNSVRARLAVEAAGVDYWRKFVGLDGDVVGMKSFGESAPGAVLMEHFGFSAENVIAKAKDLL
ncbi:MAG: transketolase [Pseudohongiellaceae bacterium]